MIEKGKYATGAALRAALEERLKQIVKAEGTELQRLRRQVAFDRFLARLFRSADTQWVLKGGYAMELRFQIARATKDLDFTVRTISALAGDAVLEHLQEAGRLDMNDFFSFRVGAPMMNLDGAPYGGSRYPVEATMGQRTFVKFHLDVGIGDIVLDPLERIQTRDWFAFAEIPPASVPMIQREQQFAEKLHAYTLPRVGTANSRVRDLVDMILLIQSGTLGTSVVAEALLRTFSRRGTHPVPAALEPPPSDWSMPFERFADECHLDHSVTKAFAELSRFYQVVFGSNS
ncbi:MAG TPA: nucleotidyl transferase AbiEii/AbiGii toxin family protein [Acidobacteriaceae bacterium]